MKPSKALARRLSSLALAVGAIPGPAVYAYPGPGLGLAGLPGTSAAPVGPGPGGGFDPGGPMRGGGPGGWAAADPGSALVRSAAAFAAGQLGEEFAGVYVVEGIRSAATQVVAGTNVALRLRIARVQDSILGARKECGVVVYVPPGARSDQLASFTCQSVDAPTGSKVPM